jgi:glycosyltransferase involved in cell wall biosynthesis
LQDQLVKLREKRLSFEKDKSWTPTTDEPLISVIVPTFKRPPYLAETVRAILAQSYPALEVLIVSDGDDQDVADYVAGLNDVRAKYLASAHAGRPAIPRNLGIRQAQGDYIAFCDDDDVWHADKLQRQMSFMRRKRSDFSFTACSNIDQNGNRYVDILRGDFGRVGKAKFLLSLGGMITNSTIVVSRSLLNRAGPLNEAEKLRSAEDYELCSRLLVHTDAVGLREPLVSYRNHIGSIQPHRVSDWLRLQAAIQAAILANGSATRLLWLGRYLRVLYWALRVKLPPAPRRKESTFRT